MTSPDARFKSKFTVGPNGCWTWTGCLNSRGYGCFGFQGRVWLAHRWSYARHVAELPDDLTLDHLCKNIRCVNPMHLEPVTRAENIRRGGNTQKTHCKRGHPLSGENLRIKQGNKRLCVTCHRAANRAYEARRAEAGQ